MLTSRIVAHRSLSPKVALLVKFLTKVVPRGLEPRTLRLLAVRSNQLSYETSWEQFTKDAGEELIGV